MASGALRRGTYVLRSAPWLALLGGSATAASLFAVAVLTHRTGVSPVAALLGLATTGGAAAYVLDEESATVLDATQASRGRRAAWRLSLLILPAAVAAAGLFALDRVDPAGHWLGLVPFAVGCLALGVGLSATLRRSNATPGDLGGVVTVAAVVLLVVADPLRRWAHVAPLGEPDGVGPSAWLWTVVIAATAAVVAGCSRDPARSTLRVRRGRHSP